MEPKMREIKEPKHPGRGLAIGSLIFLLIWIAFWVTFINVY